MYKAENLAHTLTSIASARRLPPAPSFEAFCANFNAEELVDWAVIESNLSEAYARGDLPPLSDFACHGQNAPFVGIHAISAELAHLDVAVSVCFPELLMEKSHRLEGFRQWFLEKLNDPGFYHFVVQFGVSSDPEFISVLWAIWTKNATALLECIRGRVISPSGLYLPESLSNSLTAHRNPSAWAHFCAYEGAILCEQRYELETYHLHARHVNDPEVRVVTHAGPFPAGLRSQELTLACASEILPAKKGYYGFYVPVLNESLRRLNSVLGFSEALFVDFAEDVSTAKTRLKQVLNDLNHSPNLTDRFRLELKVFKPLTAGAWGTVGVYCVIRKRPLKFASRPYYAGHA